MGASLSPRFRRSHPPSPRALGPRVAGGGWEPRRGSSLWAAGLCVNARIIVACTSDHKAGRERAVWGGIKGVWGPCNIVEAAKAWG